MPHFDGFTSCDLNLWPFELKIGTIITSAVGNVYHDSDFSVSLFSSNEPVWNAWTDGQTGGKGVTLPTGWPHNTETRTTPSKLPLNESTSNWEKRNKSAQLTILSKGYIRHTVQQLTRIKHKITEKCKKTVNAGPLLVAETISLLEVSLEGLSGQSVDKPTYNNQTKDMLLLLLTFV